MEASHLGPNDVDMITTGFKVSQGINSSKQTSMNYLFVHGDLLDRQTEGGRVGVN